MTVTSERTHDPIHRVSMAFERDGDDRLWVLTWLDPGGHLPEHFHPTLDEHWEVLEGTARVKVDGEWRDLTAEDGPVLVGRGVRHELRNTGASRRACARVVAGGPARGVPHRERPRRARGPLQRAQPARPGCAARPG